MLLLWVPIDISGLPPYMDHTPWLPQHGFLSATLVVTRIATFWLQTMHPKRFFWRISSQVVLFFLVFLPCPQSPPRVIHLRPSLVPGLLQLLWWLLYLLVSDHTSSEILLVKIVPRSRAFLFFLFILFDHLPMPVFDPYIWACCASMRHPCQLTQVHHSCVGVSYPTMGSCKLW